MENKPYVRFTYWMGKRKFFELQKLLDKNNTEIYEAKKAICLPLSNSIEIGYVAPKAWTNFDICRRQLSWYESSRYSGQYLVISQSNICSYDLELKPSTTISKVFSRPKKLVMPTQEKILQLAKKEIFQKICPASFKDIDSVEDNIKSRWLKIMGIRGITYDELFIYHCANHANFLDPEFFIESIDGPIPYSIGSTKQVCSACLEFFNIIGEKFKKKFVIPCPGAVLFAGMVVNQYYLIES
jgi:hypothetical protein